MNPAIRKATPDSEAVASSEDERPWPSAPSFGTLPRKENGVPGLGGGIWATQKRGSFKMEKAAQRNAARDARLSVANPTRSGFRAEGTPSPAASEGSGPLPFAIPLQPTPKAGRSLSHSQGQREVGAVSGTHSAANEHAQTLPLGLLTEEEADTETDSELGGAIRPTLSHPPIGTLQRTSTYPPTYESYYGIGLAKEHTEAVGGAQSNSKADRKFDSAFANLSLDPPHRRSQWQSHLGWDDVPNVNESRRHSLADIPTRRGSLVGADARGAMGGAAFWPDGYMYDWDENSHHNAEQSLHNINNLSNNNASQHSELSGIAGSNNPQDPSQHFEQIKHQDKDEYAQKIEIPSMYRVPNIHIADHERFEQEQRGPVTMFPSAQWGPSPARRKQLFIVSFKCSRAGCFFLLEGTGLTIKEGDIVIVEADRGQDLGTVQHANISPEDARTYLRKYAEEQYKWLMMFSQNNQAGSVNPNAVLYGENNGQGRNTLLANAPAALQGSRDNFNSLKPKAIKRLASIVEIRMLSDKEGNEAKAKRTCQQKVTHLHLDMEILEAEWQWDFQKLIIYYYADHYINFKDLITELYRIYKTRIWLSAINPASFSQTALGQPPSGIGPGAVGAYATNQPINPGYAMPFGQDMDPHGAVPPYVITQPYDPNYPSIPGMPNTFPPPQGNEYGRAGWAGGAVPHNQYQTRPTAMTGVAASFAPSTATGVVNPFNTFAPSRPESMLSGLPSVASDEAAQAYQNVLYQRDLYNRDFGAEQTPRPYGAPNPYFGATTQAGPSTQTYPSTIGGWNDRDAADEMMRTGSFFGRQGQVPPGRDRRDVAAGLGRQTVLPVPIGTRPGSNGNATRTQTANPGQGDQSRGVAEVLTGPAFSKGGFSSAFTTDLTTRMMASTRLAPFTPGDKASTQEATPSSIQRQTGTVAQAPAGTAESAQVTTPTNVRGPNRESLRDLESMSQSEVMQNYLQGLGQEPEDTRGDETREH